MANLNRAWKRVMFVTDNHGNLGDLNRIDEVHAFQLDYQPHETIHIGDNWEFTALRRGATDSELNCDLQADFEAGCDFLRRFRPKLVFEGNHCKRIRYLMKKPDGRLSMLAHHVHAQMMAVIEEIGAEWVPFSVTTGHRKIGAHLVMHGYAHGVNAVDVQRNAFQSPVIVGDGHAPQMITPRAINRTPSYMVGALLDFEKVDYDKNNLSGLKRGHGYLYGEYCEGESNLHMVRSDPGEPLRPLPTIYGKSESSPYPG